MTELEAGKSRPPPGLSVRLPILLTQQLSLPYWHHPLPWAPPRCQAITARPCTGLEQCGPAHSRHALWLLEGLLGHLFHGRWLMRFQRGQGQPGLWCWEAVPGQVERRGFGMVAHHPAGQLRVVEDLLHPTCHVTAV